jgi:hypothetical protein
MLTERTGHVVPLTIRPSWTVRRVLSGRGGATDPHGHTECSGGTSSQSCHENGRGELETVVLAVRDKAQTPRLTRPVVLHESPGVMDRTLLNWALSSGNMRRYLATAGFPNSPATGQPEEPPHDAESQ